MTAKKARLLVKAIVPQKTFYVWGMGEHGENVSAVYMFNAAKTYAEKYGDVIQIHYLRGGGWNKSNVAEYFVLWSDGTSNTIKIYHANEEY